LFLHNINTSFLKLYIVVFHIANKQQFSQMRFKDCIKYYQLYLKVL